MPLGSSCWPRWATGWRPGATVARIHARDAQAAERAGKMVAACPGISEEPVEAVRWCWRRGGAVPELPEVETIRRQLAERIPGRSFAAVSRCTTPSW